MRLISKLSDIPGNKPIIVTIGNFDGIHLGHRKLLEDALEGSKRISGHLVVFTFIPHPQDFFLNLNNFYINSFEERRKILEELGIEYLLEIKFDEKLSLLSPDDFLREYIFLDKRVIKLFLGHDFSFGKDKSGNLDFVKKFLIDSHIRLEIFPEFLINGDKVSSSVIRDLIRQGNLIKSNRFLGRDFFLNGKVIRGAGRGATIGVPTINLETDPKRIIPKNGVYFTRVKFQDKNYVSVTNIGYNPTFSHEKKLNIETHIIGFDKQIYNEEISIFFLKIWRDEKKFENFEELKLQIKRDILARETYS